MASKLGRHWGGAIPPAGDAIAVSDSDLYFSGAINGAFMKRTTHKAFVRPWIDFTGDPLADWWSAIDKPRKVGQWLGDKCKAIADANPGLIEAFVPCVGQISNNTSDAILQQYNSFMCEFRDRLHGYGLKGVFGPLYTGNILDARRWQILADSARTLDYLGMQTYHGPWGDFMLNDIKAVHAFLGGTHAPIVVEECGYAHGSPDVGRHADGISDQTFINSMRAFADGIEALDYVATAFVYTYAPESSMWSTFDEYGGAFEQWRATYSVGPTPQPNPNPQPSPTGNGPSKAQFDHLYRALGWVLLGNYENARVEWDAIDPASQIGPGELKPPKF